MTDATASGLQALMRDGIDLAALDTSAQVEALAWIPAATRPDSDITVLCWDGETPFFCGWWDDMLQTWVDASTGGAVEGVTHWAEPAGPQ